MCRPVLYNMTVSVEKTKNFTITRDPVRCTLAIKNKMKEQAMASNYLDVEITRMATYIGKVPMKS